MVILCKICYAVYDLMEQNQKAKSLDSISLFYLVFMFYKPRMTK